MVIGIGYRARSGKDTIASYLVNNYGFVQDSFAYPLKEYIGRQILSFTDKQLYGDWKEVLDPEWGLTPRNMLQLIGTEALREQVHKDFWVIPLKRKIKEYLKNNKHVVISDCRFINEIEMIKALGGRIIRVDREFTAPISNSSHKSESELDSYDNWDYIVKNNGTLLELYQQVDNIIKFLMEKECHQ